jgi:hypothetical protein
MRWAFRLATMKAIVLTHRDECLVEGAIAGTQPNIVDARQMVVVIHYIGRVNLLIADHGVKNMTLFQRKAGPSQNGFSMSERV